jgi:hypothetical protein
MKLAIGIISLLVAFWFLGGVIRSWPPGTYRPKMLHPSTIGDLLFGVLLAVTSAATGIALILGASWWWLLVGAIVVILGAVSLGRLQERETKRWFDKE